MSRFYVDFNGYLKIENPNVSTPKEAREYFWKKYRNSEFFKDFRILAIDGIEEEEEEEEEK